MNDSPTDQQLNSRLTLFQARNPFEPPVILLLAAFLCSLYLLAPNAADPDLWGHVRYGWDAIRQGQIHQTTTYSYLAEDYRWINHETLAELAMGWIGTHAGGPGLMLMKVGLAAYTLILLHLIIRRRTLDSLASCILLVGGAWAMRYYWGTRPQLFSFACFATLLFLLDQAFAHWYRYRTLSSDDPEIQRGGPPSSVRIGWGWLAMTPLVIAVWTNSHGGFVVGLVILGGTLLGRMIQRYWSSDTFPTRSLAGMAVIGFLALLATLVTPYGTELLRWIAMSLGQHRPEILEWGPWDASPFGQRLLWFVGLAGATFVVSRKPRDWVEIGLLALLTWQSMKHMRHSPFLVMALMAWGAPHLRNTCRLIQSTLTRLIPDHHPESSTTLVTHHRVRTSPLATLAGGALCVWFSILLVQQCSAIRVEHERYPVDAFRFLKQNQIGGRAMISFNWAQYAIDALCPPWDSGETDRSRPPQNSLASDQVTLAKHGPGNAPAAPTSIAIDGRFRTAYPQQLIDWHFDFLIGDTRPRVRSEQSGPIDPRRILEAGHPELVIVERRNSISVQTMQQANDEWVRLYQDPIAQVWGRRDVFADPDSPRFVSEANRLSIDSRPAYWSPWPAR